MTTYDFLWAKQVILTPNIIATNISRFTRTFTFGQHMILGKEWPDMTARG